MLRTVVEPREVWRLCTRDSAYIVSDLGRVRRIGGRILSPAPNSRGYLKVTLSRRRQAYVAHLVAEAFLGPRPAGHDVDHLDWQRTNNAVTNLRYIRSLENAVRWKDRVNGRNVWATPDELNEQPEDHVPMTDDELAEFAATAALWAADREEAVA